MTLFRDWVDFVVFPREPDRGNSQAARLAIEDWPDVFDKEKYCVGEPGVLTRQAVLLEGEKLEAMEINNYGYVTVWTHDRVLHLHRDRGIEKIIGLPRHPPPTSG